MVATVGRDRAGLLILAALSVVIALYIAGRSETIIVWGNAAILVVMARQASRDPRFRRSHVVMMDLVAGAMLAVAIVVTFT